MPAFAAVAALNNTEVAAMLGQQVLTARLFSDCLNYVQKRQRIVVQADEAAHSCPQPKNSIYLPTLYLETVTFFFVPK